jgi:hypothetical protein
MKKFVLVPALAALAIFFWGFLYWGTPHYLPYHALGQLPNEAGTASAMGQLFPASGSYLIPNPTAGNENMAAQMKRGPTVEIHIVKEGMAAMDARMLVKGYLHGFAICVLLMIVLVRFRAALPTGWSRVKLCACIGLFVVMADLADAIWWHHALGWTLAQAFYDFVLFLIAGLILAKFATPRVHDAAPA